MAERGVLGFSGGSPDLVYRSGAYNMTNGVERFRITGSGNVGIGTPNPQRTLHVAGGNGVELLLQNTAQAAGSQVWGVQAYGGNLNFRTIDDGVTSEVGVGKVLSLSRAGLVGIGTSSPQRTLHVAGTDGVEVLVQNTAQPAGSQVWGIQAYGGNLNFRTTNDGVTAETGAGKVLSLTRAGRVGIGTSSPQVSLDVTGGMQALTTFSTYNSDGFSTTASPGLTVVQPGGADSLQVSYYSAGGGDYPSSMRFYSPNGLNFRNSATVPFLFRVQGTSTKLALYNDGSAYFSGNVGIGTASPLSRLSVAGRLDVGSAGFSGGTGTTGMVLNGASGAAGTASQGILFGGNGVAHGNIAWMPNEHQFVFRSGNDPTDTVDRYGAASLLINGAIRSSVWQPYGSASDDFYLDVEPGTRTLRTRNWNTTTPNVAATGFHTGSLIAEGNVGIGTTNPQAKLDVVGDTRVSGNLTVGGTFSAANWASANMRVYNGASNTATALDVQGGREWKLIADADGGGSPVVASGFRIRDASLGIDRMAFDIYGNVGVGTSSPGARLHVQNDTAYTDNELLRLQSGITWGGNIGHIGLFNGGVENARIGWYMEDGNDQDGNLRFYTKAPAGALVERLTIRKSGNVGIGTATPDKALTVKGTIHATEVVVDTAIAAADIKFQPKAWADDVFAPSYRNASLAEVEQHIKEHGHLPGVPSAQQATTDGVTVGEMQATLLRKIEELTLHAIEQEKRLNAQSARIEKLEAENVALRQR